MQFKVSEKWKYIKKTTDYFFDIQYVIFGKKQIFFNKNWQNLCRFEGKKLWNSIRLFVVIFKVLKIKRKKC